jgi:hypothetical protein
VIIAAAAYPVFELPEPNSTFRSSIPNGTRRSFLPFPLHSQQEIIEVEVGCAGSKKFLDSA